MIAPLNTALDSWPAIKLNRRNRADHLRPRAGVIRAAKGVKLVVIEHEKRRSCGAGEGIRTLDVHLGKVALYH